MTKMQYEHSTDDYEREKNLDRKNVRSVHRKVRSKVNTNHTKVDIFTNELKKIRRS